MTETPDSTVRAVSGERTAALLHRVEEIEAVVERAGRTLPGSTVTQVRRILGEVRERLALGVDHTIVAMVGGTGSGKSSLFNALAGLDFADVGVRRPTTSTVTACAWAHDAGLLLDWLGVSSERRIERESALDGESQADLRGLVLLDLPDHDSVAPEHRAVVDRLLPLVDLLVWVVDPQKYADDALHSGYLRHLVGHEGAMLVVLNQIDLVPVDAQASLLRDVDRLLREDGLTGVGVHSVSARTGDGVPVLRGAISRAVSGRGIAEVRAAAELDDAARLLGTTVGERELTAEELPRVSAREGLADAAGLAAIVSAVDRSVRRGDGLEPGLGLGPAQPDRVAAVRDGWVAAVGHALPAPWATALDDAVEAAPGLTQVVDDRLAAITVRVRGSRSAAVARFFAAVAALVALGALGLAAGSALGVARWTSDATWFALSAAGAGLLALGLLVLGGALRGAAAGRRARSVAHEARTALDDVVEEMLARPTSRVLGEHRAVRLVSEARSGEVGVARPQSTGPAVPPLLAP
ncbi:GTPase [Actinotalea sp. K2]|uniref:GTPase n=1 Tax=Actinotalea sp. K2 TaxID=2939438 RepID=UPI002016D43F|nr:GTPase [Actinotalea sp. K2]MCL3860350.1 50S ribosome-binding GTPase [Actinotalea sp. K2]